jgi:hypothetical protein
MQNVTSYCDSPEILRNVLCAEFESFGTVGLMASEPTDTANAIVSVTLP